MLDEIAGEHELHFQVAIGKRIREALIDGGRRLRRAAVGEPRQRDFGRRLCARGEAGKRIGANPAATIASNRFIGSLPRNNFV
jgi:hypothetical protein